LYLSDRLHLFKSAPAHLTQLYLLPDFLFQRKKGASLHHNVGLCVGAKVLEGGLEGDILGFFIGLSDGCIEGNVEGCADGDSDG